MICFTTRTFFIKSCLSFVIAKTKGCLFLVIGKLLLYVLQLELSFKSCLSFVIAKPKGNCCLFLVIAKLLLPISKFRTVNTISFTDWSYKQQKPTCLFADCQILGCHLKA